MQILLNNAYEAWKSAIYYHDRMSLTIRQGRLAENTFFLPKI